MLVPRRWAVSNAPFEYCSESAPLRCGNEPYANEASNPQTRKTTESQGSSRAELRQSFSPPSRLLVVNELLPRFRTPSVAIPWGSRGEWRAIGVERTLEISHRSLSVRLAFNLRGWAQHPYRRFFCTESPDSFLRSRPSVIEDP